MTSILLASMGKNSTSERIVYDTVIFVLHREDWTGRGFLSGLDVLTHEVHHVTWPSAGGGLRIVLGDRVPISLPDRHPI